MPDSSTMSWILGAIGMGVSAVYIVTEIKSTTRQLRESIDSLTTVIGRIENRQIDHEVRLALLERSSDE